MKKILVNSKVYGEHIIYVDDDDYERMSKEFNNLKWSLTKNRDKLYAQKRVNGKNLYLHKYIMKYNGDLYIDHINHNTLDNTKRNLRITTNANNLRNGNIRINNKTGVNGVYYDKSRNKYVAKIRVNYKQIYLGRFNTLEEAENARKNAEILYWAVKER